MTISWTAIQALHEPDLERHWVRCRDELGLDCPVDVFEELFFEQHGDAEFGTLYRAVDWSAPAWTETELSGVLLRRVGVDRGYQYAVGEGGRLQQRDLMSRCVTRTLAHGRASWAAGAARQRSLRGACTHAGGGALRYAGCRRRALGPPFDLAAAADSGHR
jgi:hypothetical protein